MEQGLWKAAQVKVGTEGLGKGVAVKDPVPAQPLQSGELSRGSFLPNSSFSCFSLQAAVAEPRGLSTHVGWHQLCSDSPVVLS